MAAQEVDVRDPVAIVFNTTELLEQILLWLDTTEDGALTTLLFSQTINKMFQAVIQNSPALQMALGFKTSAPTEKNRRTSLKRLLGYAMQVRATSTLYTELRMTDEGLRIQEGRIPRNLHVARLMAGGSWERLLLPGSSAKVSYVGWVGGNRELGPAARETFASVKCESETTLGELIRQLREKAKPL
jgi:hypothetical protein